jgi:hypothetical protein
VDIRIREEEESISKFGLRDNKGIINTSTNIENNKV